MLGTLTKPITRKSKDRSRRYSYGFVYALHSQEVEAQREEMTDSGYQDVDIVLTTREVGRMLRQSGIDFSSLPDEDYDDPWEFHRSRGYFRSYGGGYGSSLRTAYELITEEELADINFTAVRGLDGLKRPL